MSIKKLKSFQKSFGAKNLKKLYVGRPILLITRMITDRLALYSVLLPSLLYIELTTSFLIGESVQPIFEISACDVIQLQSIQ